MSAVPEQPAASCDAEVGSCRRCLLGVLHGSLLNKNRREDLMDVQRFRNYRGPSYAFCRHMLEKLHHSCTDVFCMLALCMKVWQLQDRRGAAMSPNIASTGRFRTYSPLLRFPY